MAKAFTWSFSKLDNFETCGKKYYEYNIAKSVSDGTENIDWGNEVHDAMAKALRKEAPLPEHMTPYQPWVDRVLSGPGDLLVEQKLALDKNFNPCPYQAPTVWYRGIVDAGRLNFPAGLALDWKTGNPKEGGSVQLGLMALCLFQHYPLLKAVRSEYIWLKEDPNTADATTSFVWRRTDMAKFVSEILPRVGALEWAHKTMTFPPKPSGLCMKWCKVVSCPFHGKGSPR